MSVAETKDEQQSAAAAWAVRMDGGLSAADELALEAWLDGDPRRMGALARAQAIWCDLDRLAALDKAGVASAPPAPSRWQAMMSWRPTRYAASTVLALVVAGAMGIAAFDRLDGREASHNGEIRRLVLSDGSTVVLNTDSVVQIEFHPHQRDIYLRQGEASFQVAHDKTRPFIVHTDEVSVKAVGTSFTVRRDPRGILVTVAEGVVQVDRGTGPHPGQHEQRFVSHNLQLVAYANQPLKTAALSDGQVSRRLAWREGQLIFDGETLGQAVIEVNRYAPTPVVIDDPKLAQRSFVGVFQVGDAKAFAKAAAVAFNASATQEDDAIHLH